jgi:tetratricopeptide (TPR) repeat protein
VVRLNKEPVQPTKFKMEFRKNAHRILSFSTKRIIGNGTEMSEETQSNVSQQPAVPDADTTNNSGMQRAVESRESLTSRIEALLDQGVQAGSSGDFEHALELFSQSLEMSRACGAVILVVRSMDELAAAHWELEEHSKTRRLLTDALTIARSAGDEHLLNYMKFRLGWHHSASGTFGDKNVALTLLNEARTGAVESGDVGLAAYCDQQAGAVYRDLNEWSDAIACFERAGLLFDASGNVGLSLLARALLATVYETVGDIDRAISIYEKVLTDSEESGMQQTVKGAVSCYARIVAESGAPRVGLKRLQDFERHFHEYPARGELGGFLAAKAYVLSFMGELEEGHKAGLEALNVAEKCEGHSRFEIQAEAYEALGHCAKAARDFPQADAMYAQGVVAALLGGDELAAHRIVKHIQPNLVEKVPQPHQFGFTAPRIEKSRLSN